MSRRRTALRRGSGASRPPVPTAADAQEIEVLIESAHWSRLETAARRMVTRSPDHPLGWHALGLAAAANGALPAAVSAGSRAAMLAPDDPRMHWGLGNALRGLGLLAEAEASFRRALAIRPGFVNALVDLGTLLPDLGRYAEAEACFRQALESEPEHATIYNNLGHALTLLGRFDEAEAALRRALALRPDHSAASSNLMLCLLYAAGPPASYRAEALEYGRRVSARVQERFSAWPAAESPQRLRVGLVSGDLCRHPVGYFLEAVLAHLDPARIELLGYPTAARSDDLTARLRTRCAAWRPLVGLGDDAAARLIHADAVHVLLDLSGHTVHNRLPVFARRPAPVQASWLGYSASTGVAEIDWLIGDPHVAPPAEEWQFTERVWRLPETYLCFTPPEEDVAVGPAPALASGAVTFGSFNNLAKMNDAVVALWARVLCAVPGSRLLLKTKQLADAAVRAATLGRFAACGIGPERLLLEGPVPARHDHLAAYNRVDIALDPFPYTGTTTCVEGLWMGVPFLTKRGDRFLSHVGEGIAHNAGLSDWIAEDEDDYVAKALAHAADLPGLTRLRGGLRDQVVHSPLFDAARFARHFEDALWGMWQDWNEQESKLS